MGFDDTAYTVPVDTSGIEGIASNIKSGNNPPFGQSDFFATFPQFQNQNIPDVVINNFIAMASASVNIDRYEDNWTYCMCLYIAHFLTLYMQMSSSTVAAKVISNGQVRGLITSKSVGDVSVSMDYSNILSDLAGWAQFKSTQYGIQFATFANIASKGGMLVL